MTKRQEIIDAIVSKLKNTGEFPGGVYKVMLNDTDVSEFPFAVVLSGASSYAPLTASEYTSGNSWNSQDGWSIHILAHVKTDTDVDRVGLLMNEMERILGVVIKEMLSDPSMGLTYVRNVYLLETAQLYQWDRNIGVVESIWGVKYDFEKANP